ncbi:MAG: CoA-transferase, partial [Pseudomonadota bacterium]
NNKKGDPKLLKECTLPLTGKGVVDRIISDLGVFDVVEGGLKVVELAPEVTLDQVKERTAAAIV